MERDAIGETDGETDGAHRVEGLRILLLAQLLPFFMALLVIVAATFVCIRVAGVWLTVVIWGLLLGLLGYTVRRVLRLRSRP